jgi:hypothetical protein
MPSAREPDTRRVFIVDQSFWLADDADPERRRLMASSDVEPTDDHGRLPPAFRSPSFEDETGRSTKPTWKRINRKKLLELATSPGKAWQRVGLVCGAGLGKTTTLQWVENAINRENARRGKFLAIACKPLGLLPDAWQRVGVVR